ncbi:glycosyltransferase [Halanaerobium hydrogeniformans]|uniref:Glycosyl transferase family 2 n=1 Tax=Halanaerobium hydrogeniformans TaxID=656519 RepID=E4RM06_HALHG|nr:glycosyltransferase [Halanaerobium hydrogeniformans]ADQ14089.1 glycosyl transferase family 2 [Halanaerobium hydrogeniformans]
MKIAGVVVLYNPDEDIINNILSYYNNLELLYIVDNSSFAKEELIAKLISFDKISYFKKEDNIGIAAALNFAAEKAIKARFDWLLTMDQDSKFSSNGLPYMKNFIKVNDTEKIALITPFHKIRSRKAPKSSENEYVLHAMTSGNLVNLDIFQIIGGFNEKLFIDSVDHDYCLKANSKGYKILRMNSVILNHNLGNISIELNILGKKIITTNHNYIRRYYIYRNSFYIIKTYGRKFPQIVILFVRIRILELIKIIFFEDNKFKKIKYILKAIIDFKNNNFYKINKKD